MIPDKKLLFSERLNSLIKIQQEQIAPQVKIPTKINFYFTDRDLITIKKQKKSLKRLPLSPELLGNLRFYSLTQNSNYFPEQLVFTTYHVRESKPIAVIKSKIALSGKISQQICRAYLNEPKLLTELIVSHYWLISKICDRLPLNYKNKQTQFTTILAFGITILLAPIILFFVPVNWLFELIILCLVFCCLLLILNCLFKKYFVNFLWQQLLFGYFSKNTATRRLGWLSIRYLC